ncbi:MAG: LysM peptidoglycan-binding domain-containing protein, partial [Candidatus Sumerlaeia bacterium]|nr:LysM peptidoglycan-binding domain-containing protein [Candidatus Sumerlaeia bacterium]
DNLLVEQLYKAIVEKNVPEISEEKAKEVYEKNIEQMTQPFQFSMKHIFLSTYKEYTAQEGDTLESIAEKLCDEPSTAVLRIL